MANENIAFWGNVLTSLEYGIDIVTTISGVGNIAKFRHLAKLASKASTINKFQKTAKFASTVSKIKLAAGTIEIASGTVNALIRVSGLNNDFSKALQKYLFYLELATLAGELKGAVKQKIRAKIKESAKEALEHEKILDDLFLTQDEFIEYQEYRNIIKTLKKVSEEAIQVESKLLFRVQGGNTKPNISKFRFVVDDFERILIDTEEMLHITFNDVDRTIEFFIKRGNKSEIFVAEVNPKFVQKIKKEAVLQNQAKRYPNSPQKDDLSKTKESFGLPNNYFDELLQNIANPQQIKNK